MFIFQANINSSDGTQQLDCYSNAVLIMAPNTSLTMDAITEPSIYLKFDYSYANLVSSGKIEHVKAQFHNCIYEKYGLRRTQNIVVSPGSVIVSSGVSGSASSVSSLSSDILDGSVSFGMPLLSAVLLDKTIKSESSATTALPSNGGGGSGGGNSVADSAAKTAVNILFIYFLTV